MCGGLSWYDGKSEPERWLYQTGYRFSSSQEVVLRIRSDRDISASEVKWNALYHIGSVVSVSETIVRIQSRGDTILSFLTNEFYRKLCI